MEALWSNTRPTGEQHALNTLAARLERACGSLPRPRQIRMYRPVWRSGAGAPPAAPGSSLAAMSLKTRVPEGRRDAYPSVPGRCRLLRDERFPSGACGANRSRTARSSPQGGGAKGREANARPKEPKWAARQDVGGECARTHEAQEPLATCCRAQRRERTEPTLTRGDPGAERRRGVSRGHSSAGGTHEQKGVSMRRAEDKQCSQRPDLAGY